MKMEGGVARGEGVECLKRNYNGEERIELNEDQDLVMVGEGGGEKILVSKILITAASPLVRSLVKEQGFCSGCTQMTIILLPWVNNAIIRQFVDVLNAGKDYKKNLVSVNRSEMKDLMYELLISNHTQNAILGMTKNLELGETEKENQPMSKNTIKFKSGTKRRFPGKTTSNRWTSDSGDQKIQGTKRKFEPDADKEDEKADLKMQPSVKVQRLDLWQFESTCRNSYLLRTGANIGFTEDLSDSTTSPLLNSSYPHRGTYRCYLCKYECVSRQLLYGHYANQHFKEEMRQFSNCEVCPLCNKVLNPQSSISHIAGFHSYVEKFLPQKYHVKKQQLKRRTHKKLKCHSSTIGPLLITKDSHNKKYRCYLCKHGSVTRAKHYLHYALKHFKEEMREFSNCKVCPLCNKVLINPSASILHIANFHSYVEKFLPQKHHVKKKILQEIKKELQCYACTYSTSSRKDMYRHYSRRHFKHRILEELDGRNSCTFCDKDFSVIDNLVQHIGATHMVVEKFLAQEHIIKDLEAVKDHLVCSQCDTSFPKRRYLYAHYAEKHFSKQIEEKYGKWQNDDEPCPVCKKRLKFVTGWSGLMHLGVVHNIVEEFLDKKHHISKQTKSMHKERQHKRKGAKTNLCLVDSNDEIKVESVDSPNVLNNIPEVKAEDITKYMCVISDNLINAGNPDSENTASFENNKVIKTEEPDDYVPYDFFPVDLDDIKIEALQVPEPEENDALQDSGSEDITSDQIEIVDDLEPIRQMQLEEHQTPKV